MAQPYRRLSIGQILERVFQLCRGAWKTFVAIALVQAMYGIYNSGSISNL